LNEFKGEWEKLCDNKYIIIRRKQNLHANIYSKLVRVLLYAQKRRIYKFIVYIAKKHCIYLHRENHIISKSTNL
jgi:hypothetical protein